MDNRLLAIISCPICNTKLFFNKEKKILVCKNQQLSFPIRNKIPILLKNEASVIHLEDRNT